MFIKQWRLLLSIVIGCVAAYFTNAKFPDYFIAISAFQIVFLVCILAVDFDWKLLIAYTKLLTKFQSFTNPVCKIAIPPVQLENSNTIAVIPISDVLDNKTTDKYIELSKAKTETEKFGNSLDDTFQKMLFTSMVGGVFVALFKYIELEVNHSSTSVAMANLALALKGIKIAASVLPLCIQLALIWGTCLYLQKKNKDLSL